MAKKLFLMIWAVMSFMMTTAQSRLIVRNGGEIYLRKSHSLEIPLGATCEIPNGAIYNRPY